jgi:nitrogen regulatory protein PII
MKMVMITYNEAVDAEVMEALDECGQESYSKIIASYGKGAMSGTHLGDDIWPGRNNILYVACEDHKAKELFSAIKKLREDLGKEGVKAFILPLEEIT